MAERGVDEDFIWVEWEEKKVEVMRKGDIINTAGPLLIGKNNKGVSPSLEINDITRNEDGNGKDLPMGMNKIIENLLKSPSIKKVTLTYVLADPSDNWIRTDLLLFLTAYKTELQQKLKNKGLNIVVEIGNYDVTKTRSVGDGFFILIE